MTDYVIGPGVRQAIADYGDEARSDEQYIVLEQGDQISQTMARDAIYYYLQKDNAVRRVPF